MKKIIMTGGGTAGHVTPNIALFPYLEEAGFKIEYIGSYDGIERTLIEDQNIPYYGIDSGELRRYMDIKNFTDPFHILHGFMEAKKILKRVKPDIVFSKGGFVAVPVIFAARSLKIPVVIHESDLTPGLANKLAIPKADVVCYNFPETKKYVPAEKSVHTGLPVRSELKDGNPHRGYSFCGFREDKPLLMVIGGSLGSANINENVRKALPELLKTFNIAHICGEGKMDEYTMDVKGYRQFEYVSEELPDLFAASNLIISRAGANVICEIAFLKKPSILIPLGTDQSRGDQILNAKSFKRRGFAEVLLEENLTPASLYKTVMKVYKNEQEIIDTLTASKEANASELVTKVILKTVKKHKRK